jgi:hypothetical protein
LYSCSLIGSVNFYRGPPRFEGDRPRFGDRDGYRAGPRGAPGDFAGEKGGAPAEFQPSFRVRAIIPYCLWLLVPVCFFGSAFRTSLGLWLYCMHSLSSVGIVLIVLNSSALFHD